MNNFLRCSRSTSIVVERDHLCKTKKFHKNKTLFWVASAANLFIMDKNTSLLESLVLLAILKRQKNRNKNKKSILHGIEENNFSDEEFSINSHNTEEINYESDESNKVFLKDDDTSSSNSETNATEESELITTYSFDKQSKTLKKFLIRRDNKEFEDVKDLTNRITNRRQMCDICGKSFNEKNLKFHMNKHNNNYPYKCLLDNCKRAFTSVQMLKQHQKFHSKEKRLKCELCDRSFYMPNSLKHHRLLHFDPTIECQECGKMLHTNHSLKIHVEKVHLGIKKYACNICDKRYFNHGSLRKHLVVTHNQIVTSQRIMRKLETN